MRSADDNIDNDCRLSSAVTYDMKVASKICLHTVLLARIPVFVYRTKYIAVWIETSASYSRLNIYLIKIFPAVSRSTATRESQIQPVP